MTKRMMIVILLLSFLTFFALDDFVPAMFLEDFSPAVEYVVEDRVMEKDIKIAFEDNSALMSNMTAFYLTQKARISSYKHIIYSFRLQAPLFKPPIS